MACRVRWRPKLVEPIEPDAPELAVAGKPVSGRLDSIRFEMKLMLPTGDPARDEDRRRRARRYGPDRATQMRMAGSLPERDDDNTFLEVTAAWIGGDLTDEDYWTIYGAVTGTRKELG